MISNFRGNYARFSNFYTCPVRYENHVYPTVEHAYQAAKSCDPDHRERVLNTRTPAEAKYLGKSCTLDVHWDSIKHIVMYNLLSQKFSKEPFKSLLLSTEDEEICEGNYWHDNFWGNCSCSKCSCVEGKNVLGKLLMQVRKELR